MAVVASRSSIAGVLLRTVPSANRHLVVDFLRGLSRDELECLADFEGACLLESFGPHPLNAYSLLPVYFDSYAERCQNADDIAHKTFVVVAWLENSKNCLRISPASATKG